MVGYFLSLVGFGAVAAAAWSYNFWRVFAFGLVGTVAVMFGASLVREFSYADRALGMLAAGTGLICIILGSFFRRYQLSVVAAVTGAFLIFFGAIVEVDEFISYRIPKPGSAELDWLALIAILPLTAAAIFARSRQAPILAMLGLFWIATFGSSLRYWVYDMRWGDPFIVPDFALYAVWVILFLVLSFFSPRHISFRLLTFAVLALGITDIAWNVGLEIERTLGDANTFSSTIFLESFSGVQALAVVGVPLCLALAHRKLFETAASRANLTPDVFVSYKREERPRVEAMVDALRELKFEVWFDAHLASGETFDDEINQQVRAAKAVLVCWSPGANASDWVRAEATIGRQRGVLCACILEPCDLTPPFNLIHAEDLSKGSFTAANPSWVKLVDQLGQMVGRPALGEYVRADEAGKKTWLSTHRSDPLAKVVSAERKPMAITS